jgi:hypothetical protein
MISITLLRGFILVIWSFVFCLCLLRSTQTYVFRVELPAYLYVCAFAMLCGLVLECSIFVR